MGQLRRDRLLSIGGTALGVGGISALIALIQLAVPNADLSVLYLLPGMFSAVTWGWWHALGAAVAAFLAGSGAMTFSRTGLTNSEAMQSM